MTLYKDLKPLFYPKRVAVIGASRIKGKIGNSVFKTMVESKKFKGKVFAVNPKAKDVLGHKSFSRVYDIKKSIDLAVIVVPAKIVPQVMHDCVVKDVKSTIIISSGFSEIGNKALEVEVRNIAESGGVRVIGPNCLGIYDSYSGLDTLFLPESKLGRPIQGNISFISQSGAVGSVVLDWIASKGFGVSKFVSYGNAIDLDESDLVEYLVEDKSTNVICMYLEGVNDGRRMMHVAKRAVREKPIIVLKSGRTEAGIKAVSSHTGSLAGSDEVYSAAFKQCGMIRAEDMVHMFDYARALSYQPLPKNDRIQIITNGGGFGILATDAVIGRGLRLAKMSDASKKKLKKVLPSYAVISNPMDLAGDADSKRYAKALNVLRKDRNIDGFLSIVLFQTESMDPAIVNVVKKFNKKTSKKPLLVCSAGGGYSEKNIKRIERENIPVYDTPARAADSLAILFKYKRIKSR